MYPIVPQIQWLISMFPIGIAPGQVDGCQAGPGMSRVFLQESLFCTVELDQKIGVWNRLLFRKKNIIHMGFRQIFPKKPSLKPPMFGPSDFSWEEAVETPLMGTTWTTSCRLAVGCWTAALTRLSWYSNPPKKIENIVNSIGNQNHD